MFKAIYPNRWFLYTVAFIIVIFLILIWQISLYNIEQDLSYTDQEITYTIHLLKKHRVDSADTSSWKTYRNEKYGFEFRYPNNWRTEDQTLDVSGTGYHPLLVLQIQDNSLLIQSGNSKENDIRAFKSPPPSLFIRRINSQETILVDGISAESLRSDVGWRNNDGTASYYTKERLVIFVYQNITFSFSIYDKEPNNALMNITLSTLKFFEPKIQ